MIESILTLNNSYMKKILFLIITALMLVGCNSRKIHNKIKILVPNGIPLIAIGDLIDQDKVTIESVSGPDLLISGMVSKSHDIIIAPLNVGAKLYLNNSSSYQLHSLITFGNTYLVSKKSTPLSSINDVKNEDIMAYGRNSTPDILLKKALASSGINANISYQGGVDQVIPFFVCNPDDPSDVSCDVVSYILCAEPLITKLELEYGLELNVLDLQAENEAIPQAAIFVNPECDEEALTSVLALIEANVQYLNENPQSYAHKIITKHLYFKNLGETIIAHCIPRSNINFMKAVDHKEICENFFMMLNEFNPDLLGGEIPNLEFYY